MITSSTPRDMAIPARYWVMNDGKTWRAGCSAASVYFDFDTEASARSFSAYLSQFTVSERVAMFREPSARMLDNPFHYPKVAA